MILNFYRRYKTILESVVLVVLVVVAGFYYKELRGIRFQVDDSGVEVLASPPDNLSLFYKDDTYKFSFNYPSGFTITEPVTALESSDVIQDALLIQDESGDGFQIIISSFTEPTDVLTPERVRADIPDLKIEAVQEVLLGNGGKGLAFKSNNDSFGGSSREVWFVFDGSLYQISTYIRNDPLLQAVLGTWEFTR